MVEESVAQKNDLLEEARAATEWQLAAFRLIVEERDIPAVHNQLAAAYFAGKMSGIRYCREDLEASRVSR